MPSPFPGMDPYLESPTLWPDVHHGLISHIQKSLNPALRPRDVARVELRVYISDLIDEEIEEARLEIRHLETGSLVTVIEVLSPTNKIRGARGRASFIDKRRETLASEVHWVEIDLLRIGVPSVTNPPLAPSDYRILVSRAGHVFNESGELVDEAVRNQLREFLRGFAHFVQSTGLPQR